MARKGRSKGTGSLYRRTPTSPWVMSWYDHSGKRRERSARTADRATAERILAKQVADAALRRDLVIDPKIDRFASEGRRPLADHIDEYIAHCRHAGQDSSHVSQKHAHLKALVTGGNATRLAELTADALERHLSAMKGEGRSARSLNFARQIAVAFYGWCVKTGRAESNPLRTVPKQDESRDRRRVRRPLTDDELSRLLDVARQHGRESWYLAAALAGLRKGDLRRLTWCDVDLRAGTITIRHGKAKRVDVIPLHPQLAAALQTRQDGVRALPGDRVWPQVVQDLTRRKDFLRAGIARRVAVVDADGKPVIVGKGKRARQLTRISVEDEAGTVIDLHALRTTLGTRLARAGVTPQVAQRVMRHSDYRTTLKHYTVLGLDDTSRAVARLPGVARGSVDAGDPQRYQRRLVAGNAVGDRVADDSGSCNQTPDSVAGRGASGGADNDLSRQSRRLPSVPGAVAQLVERQLCKLDVRDGSPDNHSVSDADSPTTSDSHDDSAPIEPGLAAVAAAWHLLPAALRAGIVAMVADASRDRAG